jgi:hypothetical protein
MHLLVEEIERLYTEIVSRKLLISLKEIDVL